MSKADDATEIRRLLEDRIESVLDAIASGWKRRGDKAYLTPKSEKDLGSFTVQLKSAKFPRGTWRRFSQDVGGGSVELVAYQLYGRTDAYKEAFAWARQFLGIDQQRQETPAEAQAREQQQKSAEAKREEDRKRQQEAQERRKKLRTQSAQDVLAECLHIKGTLAEKYLVSRGLSPVDAWPWDPKDVLGFHPSLEVEGGAVWENGVKIKEGPKFAALVARVVDAFGDTISCWQIYLTGEAEKADLSQWVPSGAKIGRGPSTGGAVRLGGDAADIGGAEGIESALAAWELEDFRRPVWAFLSTSGMRSFEPPVFIESIRLWTDSDYGVTNKQTGAVEDPPGISAGRYLQGRMQPIGIPCSIQDGCIHGDALDLLKIKREYSK